MSDPWQAFLAGIAARLADAGIESRDSRVEARLLAQHALGLEREQMILRRDAPAPVETLLVEALVERRLRREPLAYIVGLRWFHGLQFQVGPAVLVPRPETEMLVEWALERFNADEPVRIADIGTGSGCIAVAIAARRPEARIHATDISEAALDIARANALRHKVAERIDFRHGDLLAALDPAPPYDALLVNPPYIPESDRPTLAPEVESYEPSTALFGPGVDGLGVYRRLASGAAPFLKPGGALAVEVGAGQADAVADLFAESGWTDIHRHPDLAGIERMVVAIRSQTVDTPEVSSTRRSAGQPGSRKEDAGHEAWQ